MQFNSYIFILLFLPICTIAYLGANRINTAIGKTFIILASALFYFYGGWQNATVLIESIIVNLAFSFAINKLGKYKKALLFVDITSNVAILLYFKYFNFFIENYNELLGTEHALKDLILPIGISFFTFQQIMYVVNVYENKIDKVNIIDYLIYILYFPKILMGPLVEPTDLIGQFNDDSRKTVNWNNISSGLKLFSFGLFKKLIIADTFATAVSWGYSNSDISTSMDWFLIMLSYTFEIYFDFSGYSDMAVGVSKMINIDLPINFDSPYKALSIRDFWKRWHMSLTNFLTKYIYIPLGGSKKGKFRTYINTMIVFLISGIWHGANWTFILWGILHGLFSVLDRIFEKYEKKLFDVVKWCCTFLIVNVLWLLFRSYSISQWWAIIKAMFTFQNMAVSDGIINSFVLPETTFILNLLHLNGINEAVRGFSLLVFCLFSFGICLIPENNYRKQSHNNWLTMVIAALAFVWGFLCLSSESVFVYFNF
jgi:D-alanyl-lipoteichoic acid acyltransferase DltB (MBOAT superfamily)